MALHAKTKAEAGYRFYALYDKISREDILAHAYAQCRSNKGAPGIDGQDFADIEAYGVERWLAELALALRQETYRPEPIRRVFIPKANGKLRPLGISSVRDRVCMTAALLVLEPIFEADLPSEIYAYRAGRNAQQAVVEVGGKIVHKEQSHPGEHTPIIDQPLWDAVQAQLARNAAERNSCARHPQPSLLAGLLFDGDGNRMTPSHAVKKGTRYRYYVSGSLITKDRTDNAAALRIPAAEIEQLVSDRVHRWLLDPGSIDKRTAARLVADPSIQHRRIARAAD